MVKLSQAIGATQKQLTSKDKLSLNYKQISLIDSSQAYAQVKKLFLSHNLLVHLDGIQSFPNLTHLSVSHNRLASVQEVFKVKNPSKLECLAIAGNYFIDRDPDFRSKILVHFTGLKELDC